MTKPARVVLLPLALAVLLAGCGGGGGGGGQSGAGNGAQPNGGGGVNGVSVGNCLNEQDFIVQPSPKVLDGTSPGGVAFTLTFYKDAAAAEAVVKKKDSKTTALVEKGVVDFHGNPSAFAGAPPAKISKTELKSINDCIESNK